MCIFHKWKAIKLDKWTDVPRGESGVGCCQPYFRCKKCRKIKEGKIYFTRILDLEDFN